MALTETPLTMANAVHAFAKLDTTRQVRMLRSEGQSYATEDLVDRMRAAYPVEWAALVLRLSLSDYTSWADYVDDMLDAARHIMRTQGSAAA